MHASAMGLGCVLHTGGIKTLNLCLHGDSDPNPDPDWLRLHEGKFWNQNPDSDHLSRVDL